MAGAVTLGSIQSLIVTSESLNTLATKLYQLFSSAALTGFSDAESSPIVFILRSQASAPATQAGRFWDDTTTGTIRHYEPAGLLSWQPVGVGAALNNNTGGTRVLGDVVGFSASPTGYGYDGNATARLYGVVSESTLNGSNGLVRMAGLMASVKVDGTVARGDFIGKSGSAGNIAADVSGPTNSIGIAMTTPAGGTCTALLWPFIGT